MDFDVEPSTTAKRIGAGSEPVTRPVVTIRRLPGGMTALSVRVASRAALALRYARSATDIASAREAMSRGQVEVSRIDQSGLVLALRSKEVAAASVRNWRAVVMMVYLSRVWSKLISLSIATW